jgi:hypothetical protein
MFFNLPKVTQQLSGGAGIPPRLPGTNPVTLTTNYMVFYKALNLPNFITHFCKMH